MKLIQITLNCLVGLGGLLHNKPALVSACGGFFCEPSRPVLQEAENIAFGVVLEDDGNGNKVMEVTMAVQINYQGPAQKFAWVLPVMKQPTLEIGSELLFSGLFDTTRPTYEFTIDYKASETCSEDFERPACAFREFDGEGGVDEAFEEEEVEILEAGTVGPFEFSIIEAKDGNEDAVFDYLKDNGFDQPDQSEELITQYARDGMVFVTLKLTKDSETGDVTPIVLKYQVPEVTDLYTAGVSCVPLRLTRIAAVQGMPIQIYMLGPDRGTPTNYFHTILSEESTDWLGCGQSNFFQQDCFLADFRSRFRSVVNDDDELVNGRAFTTEFAGPLDSIDGIDTSIEVDSTLINELQGQTTASDFLDTLDKANLLNLTVVQTIVQRYVRVTFPGNRPSQCIGISSLSNTPPQSVGNPPSRSVCFDSIILTPQNGVFDSTGLFNELNDRVFIPAENAQLWMNSHDYLTRMYAELDPDQMNHDPLFIFKRDLPDVSRFHKAVAVPECERNEEFDFEEGVGLSLYFSNDENVSMTTTEPYYIEASPGCGTWFATGSGPVAFARTLDVYTVEGMDEESISLVPDDATGLFATSDVENALSILNEQSASSGGDNGPPSNSGGSNSGVSNIVMIGTFVILVLSLFL